MSGTSRWCRAHSGAPLPTEAQLWEALGTVTDPEYPLSIVDLGMVYGAVVEGRTARVTMTFTSIGCPAIEMLVTDVRDALGRLSGVSDVEVAIVWDPPWNKNRISDRGRKVLAVYGVVS
jgi:metal-sulfur cluster biosynthetic enzyme